MTDRLKAALRDLADDAPAPADIDVWPAAVRRRRVRSIAVPVVVVLAVVAIVLSTMSLGLLSGGKGLPTGPTGSASVPQHIGLPWIWQADPRENPPGPVAAIFSGQSFPLDNESFGGSEGNIGLVGANTDTYRMLLLGSTPAVDGAALSPDGNLLAIAPNYTIDVINLSTGVQRSFLASPQGNDPLVLMPLGFLPDGRTLIVSRSGGADGTQQLDVALLDTTTGASRTLPYKPDEVAPSSDGTRVAVSQGRDIFLAPTAGGAGQKLITMPAGAKLAGPAGWSADGRTIVVADPGCGSSCGNGLPYTWTLGGVDRVTGKLQADLGFPKLDALYVYVVGWRGPDVPVVTLYHQDSTAEVLALHRGQKPEVIVSRTHGINRVAVASNLLASGAVRPGADPPPWPAPTWVVVVSLVILALLALAVWRFVRRRLQGSRNTP